MFVIPYNYPAKFVITTNYEDAATIADRLSGVKHLRLKVHYHHTSAG
jgi:hypothetical protein